MDCHENFQNFRRFEAAELHIDAVNFHDFSIFECTLLKANSSPKMTCLCYGKSCQSRAQALSIGDDIVWACQFLVNNAASLASRLATLSQSHTAKVAASALSQVGLAVFTWMPK